MEGRKSTGPKSTSHNTSSDHSASSGHPESIQEDGHSIGQVSHDREAEYDSEISRLNDRISSSTSPAPRTTLTYVHKVFGCNI